MCCVVYRTALHNHSIACLSRSICVLSKCAILFYVCALLHFRQGGWCIFDFKNSESPCHSQYCNEDIDTAGIAYAGLHIDKSCEEMLDDTTGRQAEEVHLLQSACCLKTVLNYCKRFEDRACVVEIPGLLNKLTNANIKVLEALKVRRH